jgi:DNA-binding Lrp family transcriptional regulator
MKEILEILRDNDRVSPEQMSVMLGLEADEVKRRIAGYEQDRVILKYHALIDWEKAGEELVTALIDVKVTPERDFGFDQIAERLYRFPEVQTVYLMSGGYDLSVVVEGKTMKEVALFVAEKLAPIEHVLSCATHFILKRYKQDGVIFSDEKVDKRLVVTP